MKDTNMVSYTSLRLKTVDELYNILPINGHARLMVDRTGRYYPDRDKERVGNRLVMSVEEYTEDYLYVRTY